jgi:acetyltransferase-like isoleucine patch superfamily enzyme
MIKRRLERKLAYTFLRLIQAVRKFGFRFVSTAIFEGYPLIHQPVQFVGKGKISFGSNVNIGVFPSPYYLMGYTYLEARGDLATIEIGDDTWINNNFVAIAEHSKIKIGSNVLIGTNVEIYDSDFHGLKISQRNVSLFHWAKPVIVGNNVFIGSNVKILKGVSIGAGSIIANGSIVVNDIPENTIAGGNPARVIREIEPKTLA